MTDPSDEIHALYASLINCWNQQDAGGYANLISEIGSVVGFDGSMLNGRAEVERSLREIFASHPTPPYISIVREVRLLSAEVALLRAVAGMVPPGKDYVDPALNAVQSLVAVKEGDDWRVALFQNTPAALHGRPNEVEKLTSELRKARQR